MNAMIDTRKLYQAVILHGATDSTVLVRANNQEHALDLALEVLRLRFQDFRSASVELADWETRVRDYEAAGLARSDAQAVADCEEQ